MLLVQGTSSSKSVVLQTIGTVTHSDSKSLAVTHSYSQSLAVTYSHSQPLVVTCSHLQSLAVTRSHSQSLAVTCSHLQSLVVTHDHLQSLAVTHSITLIKENTLSLSAHQYLKIKSANTTHRLMKVFCLDSIRIKKNEEKV